MLVRAHIIIESAVILVLTIFKCRPKYIYSDYPTQEERIIYYLKLMKNTNLRNISATIVGFEHRCIAASKSKTYLTLTRKQNQNNFRRLVSQRH